MSRTVKDQTGQDQTGQDQVGEVRVLRAGARAGDAARSGNIARSGNTSSDAGGRVDRGAAPWGRRRVLLLNATYEPLTAISTRRAIVLILRERADLVHADADGVTVHSARQSVPIPSVIRLRSYVRVPYRAVVPMTRAALMHRDRFRCGYCNGRATTIDHVVPRSRGGSHGWENCVACCAGCNHRKADRLLKELGWTLRVTPSAPKGRHWRLLASVKEIDPSWIQYIDAGAA